MSDFPASSWQLNYYFRSREAANKDIVLAWGTEVTADGDTFQIRTAPAATDTEAEPGSYELVGIVTDGTDTYEIFRELVRVLSNPATATGGRSHAKYMMDTLEAAMRGGALTQEQRRVAINGRSIEKATSQEIREEYAYWKGIVIIGRTKNARLSHAARMVCR